MRRTPVLLALLVAGVVGVVLAVSSGGPGRETARDVAESLQLRDDPPFAIGLSGPLWQDRTLRSEDGAPDFAYVTRDEGLDAVLTGAEGARVAEVELSVDGRLQRRVRPPCPNGQCPLRLRLAFRPRLRGPVSADRHLQLIVRDRKGLGGGADVGPHVSVATFTVHVGRRLPLVRGGEPVTARTLRPAPAGAGADRLRAGALKVLSAQRRGGSLNALLGSGPLRVREAGELVVNGRPLGATLLLELTRTRRNVVATVPAYAPAASRPGGYRAQTVRLRAPVLRDLLVDVDLNFRRVIAVEPGPRSETKTWTPGFAPTPAGAEDED